MINGHGSDAYRYKGKVQVDFSSNVWYQGPPAALLDYLPSQLKHIVHYPEPMAESLVTALASHNKLDPKQVIVGNGSVEIFYAIAQLFSGKTACVFYPAFAEYADACQLFGVSVSYRPYEQLYRGVAVNNELIWLGNPNNPDGNVLNSKQIKALCRANPNSLVVVDEAYAELCHGFEAARHLLDELDNLIITRSLTKTFAMPGLRLGYALASAKWIEQLTQIKLPWTVNTMALAAGNFLLQHYKDYLPNTRAMRKTSIKFQAKLAKLKGVSVIPSECNYFLCRLHVGTASELKTFLVENYGLLIRDASNFKGLNKSHFRLAIQAEENNLKLISGLQVYLAQYTQKTNVKALLSQE